MTTHAVGELPLSIESLVSLSQGPISCQLTEGANDRIRTGRRAVDALLAANTPAYGITTGVGSQKDHPVSPEDAADYNRRLIRGHATRVPGPQVRSEVVRSTLLVLLHQFSTGHVGVSPDLVDLIVRALKEPEMPEIDAAGSVGASDLVPLSQLADWLFSLPDTNDLPKAKDALSLINCNAISLATGAFVLTELTEALDLFDLAATLTMEGFRSNLDAISEPVNAVHQRPAQASIAAKLRDLLDGSALWADGEARLLQDPLSFRNVSQIHGATREVANHLVDVWNSELNSVVVNPLVNIGPKAVYSHGNMDTTRMTLALDTCRQALAKTADVSGERIHKTQWPNFSGLPIGLAAEDQPIGGVQFLNLGHIAASIITSIKIWAQPHLLHSVGQVADGVEDTASHALHAVHDLERQVSACRHVASIEIAVATWSIDRRGLCLAALGAAPRRIVEAIRPLLPIGQEGDEVFDLDTVVDALREEVNP